MSYFQNTSDNWTSQKIVRTWGEWRMEMEHIFQNRYFNQTKLYPDHDPIAYEGWVVTEMKRELKPVKWFKR